MKDNHLAKGDIRIHMFVAYLHLPDDMFFTLMEKMKFREKSWMARKCFTNCSMLTIISCSLKVEFERRTSELNISALVFIILVD
jgi:hypothetical protein